MTKLWQLIVLSFVPYATVFIGLYVLSNAWYALFLYHLAILVIIMIHFKKIDKISFSIQNKKLFIFGTISTLFVLPVLYFLWNVIKLPELNLTEALSQFQLSGRSLWLFILILITIHPILEEIYWRFIIFNTDNKKLNYLFDVLFAGYHVLVLLYFVKLPFIILSLVVLFLTAIVWRMIKEKNQDHVTLFVTHALADFAIMMAILLLSLK